MKMRKKILPLLTAACFTVILPAVSVQAAQPERYTYTVSIYAGNQGTFAENAAPWITVDKTESGSTVKSSVDTAEGMVTISGLEKDDVITFDQNILQTDAVRYNAQNRYYIKGIRQSGQDNSMATYAYRVDRDADCVLAYGVKGNMVAYTVNYQDADGNELLPSETFYGNVGDKPVIAYKYRDGYEPDVRALTKTLDANETKNIFTFTYHEADRGTVTRQTGTPGITTNTITELLPGTVPAVIPGTTTEEAAETEAEGETGQEAGDAGTGGGEPAAEGENQAPLQELGDEQVPLANQDLKDLDEEEIPASSIQLDKVVKKGLPLAACIGIAIAAVSALAILAVVVKKRRDQKGITVKSE